MEKDGKGYIRAVIPLKDYRLFMELESGSSVIVDLSTKLKTIKYLPLSDTNMFETAETDGDYVMWGGGQTKVSVKELMDLVLLGEI